MINEEMVLHWIKSAGEDKKAAQALYASGHFLWCLFLWHLTIEKTLKAILTKQDKEIPFTHNLVQLMRISAIDLNENEEKQLKEITSFNLEARYDDYKLSFYKKASREYAVEWVEKCSKWLEKLEKYL